MKRILIPTLLLLLLVISCDKEDRSWYVLSENESTIYLTRDGVALVITVPEYLLASFSGEKGIDRSKILEDLFGPGVSENIERDAYEERKELITLLLSETGANGEADAYAIYGKDLSKSAFLDRLDDTTRDIDEREIVDLFSGMRHYGSLDLGRVMKRITDYEDARAYINQWLERAKEVL